VIFNNAAAGTRIGRHAARSIQRTAVSGVVGRRPRGDVSRRRRLLRRAGDDRHAARRSRHREKRRDEYRHGITVSSLLVARRQSCCVFNSCCFFVFCCDQVRYNGLANGIVCRRLRSAARPTRQSGKTSALPSVISERLMMERIRSWRTHCRPVCAMHAFRCASGRCASTMCCSTLARPSRFARASAAPSSAIPTRGHCRHVFLYALMWTYNVHIPTPQTPRSACGACAARQQLDSFFSHKVFKRPTD
jgi:hypothetical protein